MKSPLLKRFRVLFAVLFFISVLALFVDFKNVIPSKFYNILLSLQFIPSLLKFYDLKTILAGGFIAIIILTFITGRTYCSFLCPLGIGQDIFSRIGGKLRKKFRRYGFKKPFTVTRYFFLGASIIVTIVWGISLLTLLDPYSIFGRFMTFFGKPAILWLNNLLAGVLIKFDIYTLSHITIKGFPILTYSVPLFFLFFIGTLSLAKGRLFCNMICPVGTFLGLLSKVSLFRIKIDESACQKCSRCSIGCKGSCIDFLHNKIDVTRCVSCFNCVNICPDKAISYGLVNIKKKPELKETDENKRKFIVGSILLLLGLPTSLKAQEKQVPSPKKASTVKENRTCPVVPPGAISVADFNTDCTACSLCISACPNEVLEPSFLQYGIQGIMQPIMNYHKSFCTYNCTRCTEVCPTNALHPLVAEAKKLVQIGKVNFIKDNCIKKQKRLVVVHVPKLVLLKLSLWCHMKEILKFLN